MSKKTWRDRKATPIFAFTLQTVDLTLKAVALFEQTLQRANPLDEKVVFAAAVMQSVRQKLEAMRHSVGAMCLTGFDYNEKIVIRHALLAYRIELLATPPTPRRARELRQCQVIATSFTDDEGRIP
jgi:hypothetical protein